MAIETHQDLAEPAGSGPEVGGPGGVMRPWWLRPGAHVGVIGAVVGYILGHLLGNFLSSAYQQNALSDSNDIPIVLGYAFGTIGWLAGLGVFNDLGRQMLGKPLLAEVRRGGRRDRPVEVLQVHARPQGGRHPVPVRHDRATS